MSEDEYGEIENYDLPQTKQKVVNPQRKSRPQEDEFEYFDDDDYN